MVNDYDIEDIVEYVSCPFKLTFQKADEEHKIFENTIGEITTRLCYYYIGKKFLDKPVSKVSLNNKLNEIWGELKKRNKINIGYNNKKERVEELLLIKSRIDFVLNLIHEDEEFIAFDYETSKVIAGVNITGTILSVTRNQENIYKVYVIPKIAPVNDMNDSYYYMLIGNFIHKSFLEELEGLSIDLEVIIINPYKGILYKPLIKKEEIKYILEDILKGLKNDIYYPRPSYYTCKYNCKYKKQCPWKIKK